VSEDAPVADEEAEELDGVPVLSEVRTLERRPPAPLVVQAAAVAAGGFVAGAATAAIVRHHRVKKAARRQRRRTGQMAAGIVASRSFLIDVHLLGSRE
jgi:hypothetical protein